MVTLIARAALVILIGGALGYNSSFSEPCKRAISTPAKTDGVITRMGSIEVDMCLKSQFTAILGVQRDGQDAHARSPNTGC